MTDSKFRRETHILETILRLATREFLNMPDRGLCSAGMYICRFIFLEFY